jgi:hypothetical protein
MMRKAGSPILFAVVVALVTVGAACGEATRAANRLGRQLRAAERFTGFPLYWAGKNVGRLPLTAVDRGAEHFGEGFTFVYGTCVPSSGDESGCAPPLEVQVTSLCNRLPRDLGIHRLGPRRRGAWTSAAEAGGGGADVSLYVKGATITIYAAGRALADRAIAALRGANALAAAEPGGSLPAATRAEIAGRAC